MANFTVNIMTATLAPGDAIGNYVLTSARLWRSWGARVDLFADFVMPVYGSIAHPSSSYLSTGRSILWFHYSIYADNVQQAIQSQDFKVMDFHGITPPHLFRGQDLYMETVCQKGYDVLPTLRNVFDLYIVHSEYTRQVLVEQGFDAQKIHKLPLCVDTGRFNVATDDNLAAQLQQLEYFLLIGRIVPQKDILALLEIFAHIHAKRPNTVLILVGSRSMAADYQHQIERRIKQLGLQNRVMFTEQVNDTAVLATLLRHAKLLFVTSEWETFCVPAAEAMYFGVPAVVHNLPPLPEVVGEAGLVINKHKAEEAGTAVLQLLNNPDQYQQLSQAARHRAQQFTDGALAHALLSLFQQLFPSQPPTP